MDIDIRSRRHGRAAALLLGAFVVAGCAGAAGTPGSSARPETTADGNVEMAMSNAARLTGTLDQERRVAVSMNGFGVELFERTAADGNAVVSPTSVALALAMARSGARGETAAGMDTALRGVGSDATAAGLSALAARLAGVSRRFDENGETREVSLRIANAAFGQRGYRFEQPYLDALSSRFGAGLRLVDYRKDAEAARKTINKWVSDNTERRIPEILGPGALDEWTRLALANAIYLKAPWQRAFMTGLTAPDPFTLADGGTVEVPMMNGRIKASLTRGKGFVAADIPYAGGALSLLVVVPDDLAALEIGLTGSLFDSVPAPNGLYDVDVTLPKFKIETRADLTDVLPGMGMPLAFSRGEADFTGITTEEPLYISAVVHQANIDVDEKGTEAAAATVVAMAAGAAPNQPTEEPPHFRADRPFLFALRETHTGAILFLGRVADPSKG